MACFQMKSVLYKINMYLKLTATYATQYSTMHKYKVIYKQLCRSAWTKQSCGGLGLPVCGRLWLSMTQMVSAHRPQTQGEPSLWSVHNLFWSRSFPLCPFLFEPSLAHVNHASHMQQTPDWGGKKMQWPSGHFFFYTYTKTTKVEMDEDI